MHLGITSRPSNITCKALELSKLEAFPNYTGSKPGYFTDAKLLLAGMNKPRFCLKKGAKNYENSKLQQNPQTQNYIKNSLKKYICNLHK